MSDKELAEVPQTIGRKIPLDTVCLNWIEFQFQFQSVSNKTSEMLSIWRCGQLLLVPIWQENWQPALC